MKFGITNVRTGLGKATEDEIGVVHDLVEPDTVVAIKLEAECRFVPIS
jgi:tRNA(Ser,Leu) C12 N-acetylase TAN1